MTTEEKNHTGAAQPSAEPAPKAAQPADDEKATQAAHEADKTPREDAEPAQEAPPESAANTHGKTPKADHAAKFAAQLAGAQAKAEELEHKLGQAKDTLLRTAAEYDNYRKRSAREHDAAFGNGVSSAVEVLLPVVDTLTMAAEAACADETYKKGVLMTLDQCKAAFAKLGVTEMHEAVMQQPTPEGTESGTVLQVLKAGYLLHDKVVRHATVVVAQ